MALTVLLKASGKAVCGRGKSEEQEEEDGSQEEEGGPEKREGGGSQRPCLAVGLGKA